MSEAQNIWKWLTGSGDPITATTRLTILAAAAVILSAAVLGYTALFDLFVSISLFWWPLAIFFPLLFDLAEIAAANNVLNAKLQGEEDKFSWRMVLVFTGLGIAANIAHAGHAWWNGRIDNSQTILALIFTSLFPLSVALATHLLKIVIERQIRRDKTIRTIADLQTEVGGLNTELNTLRLELDRLNGQIVRAQARLEDIKAETNREISANVHDLNLARQAKIDQRRVSVLSLLREGLSPTDIAGELGVTVKTIKRDIAALNGQVTGVMN